MMAIMAFPPLEPKNNSEYILLRSGEKALTFSKPKHYVCNKICIVLCKYILIMVVAIKHSTSQKKRRKHNVTVNSPASEG